MSRHGAARDQGPAVRRAARGSVGQLAPASANEGRGAAPVGALVALVVLWWRGVALRRAAVVLTVAFALVGAVFVSISAFTPTAGVAAQERFGRYQQAAVVQLEVGALAPGTMARARAALQSAAPGAHLSLYSVPLNPDSNPPSFFFLKGFLPTQVIEDGDLPGGFPGRYHLDSGRWPTKSGEVAISPAQQDLLAGRGKFTVMSGQATMHVVGLVTDAQHRHDKVVIAAPGTTETLAQRPPQRRYQVEDYQLQVLWSSPVTAQQVAGALAPLLPPSPDLDANQGTGAGPLPGDQGALSQANTATQIAASASSRASSGNAPPGPAFGSDRFVVSYLPLALLALLAAAFAAASARAAQHDHVQRLTAVGIARSTLTFTRGVAVLVVGALSIAGGLAAGWAIAAALRPTVFFRLADQPLSPIPALPAALVAIGVGAALVVAIATVWPQRRGQAVLRAPGALAALAWVRRAGAIGAAVAAFRIGGGVYSVSASYLIVAAVLLAAPDALALAVGALPRARARAMLTASMMRADIRRQAVALVVVAACIAVPVCAGTQLVSRTASDNTFGSSAVPAGQV